MIKTLAAAAALALATTTAIAQSAGPTVSAAKKDLVAKVLQLQQAGYEAFATQLALAPASQAQQQLRAILPRVPADKREALARDLQADLIKYADEVTPIAREAARKNLPSTVGAVLEQQMSEEELRQVITVLENPAHRKFLSLSGEMQRALAEKLAAETRTQLEPKAQALQQSIQRRLAAVAPAAPASAPPAGGSR